MADEPDSFRPDDRITQLRLAAETLLEKTRDATMSDLASAIETAGGAMKTASDLEKSALEVANLRYEHATASKRERSERIKEYVSLLAPIVAVITLAGTLSMQTWQFLRSEKDKSEAAVEAQWQETVKLLSASGALSPGVAALHPFLNSPKYADQARTTAVQLLATSTDPSFFASLFGPAFVPISSANSGPVLVLDRAIAARFVPVADRSWNEKIQNNDMSKLQPEEQKIFAYGNAVIPTLTAQIGSVLRSQRLGGSPLDLSGTYFMYGYWDGVDLSDANIQNMRLTWSSLKNANLNGITQFSGAYLYRTTWWQAARIARPLLDYLAASFKCEPGTRYGPHNETFTQAQCDADLARLTAQTP